MRIRRLDIATWVDPLGNPIHKRICHAIQEGIVRVIGLVMHTMVIRVQQNPHRLQHPHESMR
jgi:hypothetical protein